MSHSTVYAIPVRPHVRQFMLAEFGVQQPLSIHQNTFLGRTLGMMVEKQPYRMLDRPQPVPVSGCYTVTLPTALKHYTLTKEAARDVGEMMEKFFQQQFIVFVKGQIAATRNERRAIRCFFKLYDINPSDYDLEHARKAWRDYKDRVLKENGHLDKLYGDDANSLFDDHADSSQ